MGLAAEYIVITEAERQDRAAIRRICCNTGYAGGDIRPYFDDLELFADMLTLYYTDFEPQSTFVARAGGNTVGYLCGSLNSRRYNHVLATRIIPRLLSRALMGDYRLGRSTYRYILNILGQLSPAKLSLPHSLYPAHLHINIEKDYRQKGIGRALLNRYRRYLHKHGIRGVHLGTTSLNGSAVPFFEKLGFELYSRVKNSSFEGRKAYLLTYVKIFDEDPVSITNG